jgi:hypothetical protein
MARKDVERLERAVFPLWIIHIRFSTLTDLHNGAIFKINFKINSRDFHGRASTDTLYAFQEKDIRLKNMDGN